MTMQASPADLRTPHGSTSQLLDEDDSSSEDLSDVGKQDQAPKPVRGKAGAQASRLSAVAAAADETATDDTQRQDDAAERLWHRAKHELGMKPGVRFYPYGGGPDYQQSALMSFLALFTMGLYLGWIHILTALFVASFYSRVAAVVLAAIWSTVLLPAKPLLWDRFLSLPIFRLWAHYFNYSIAYDEEIDLTKRYVLAEVPHGVFPMSQLIAVSVVRNAWPHYDVYGIAASSVFKVPFWRHVMAWLGTVPATEQNFRHLLRQRGSVGVVPGGVAEMFMTEEHADVVKLAARKGFVRMAVENGVDLLPVYHFGNSRLFRWVPKAWEAPSRRWRTSLGFMLGRWNLPLPHRVPLFMVVGPPVPVKQVKRGEPGFDAAVDEAHAALCDAIQALYDKYKGMYGWSGRPLIMK